MPRSIDILLLTNDAGSGHRSAALALEAAFSRLPGAHLSVAVKNPVQQADAPALLRQYERVYVNEMQQAPGLYHIGYTLSDLPGVAQLLHHSVRQMLQRSIAQILSERHYHLVISVYPIYSAIVAKITQRAPRRPAIMTVVTDLGSVHSAWFNRTDDVCAVPTVMAHARALKCNMRSDQVVITGMPVHPSFGSPRADQATLRRELGWEEHLPTLLLMGGGAGVGQLAHLATALDSVKQPLQLAVVAGKNEALVEQLRAHPWQIPTHVYGFVQLADLMHAADIVATKAGGLTVSEALAAGKPLLIHGDPPGQEEGNLRYVQTHGAGLWVEDANAMVAFVSNWLMYPAQMERAAANARRLGRPDAAKRIARLGWDLVLEGPRREPPVLDRSWWRSAAGL
jgi:1,2-diacylglycerol 3-beta-galactosyltransferase